MAEAKCQELMTCNRIIAFLFGVLFVIPAMALAQDLPKEPEKPVEKKEKEKPPAKEKPAEEEGEDKISFPLDHFYAKRKPNAVRTIFKNFSFGLSTGYGNTFFSHELTGFGIVQPTKGQPMIFPAGGATDPKYVNWINNAMTDTLAIKPGYFLVSSDTAKLGFKGHGFNIPLKATLHYEYDRYRVGAGYSLEYMHMGEFQSISYKNDIHNFNSSGPNGLMKKYFGMLGVSFYRWNDILFTADANVGGYKPGKNFNYSLIKKGVYVNVGVMIEKEFSEYLKGFIRPSFEIKNYQLNLPEVGKVIDHSINAFYINIGLSYKIPELAKCYNKDCRVQMNHAHGDREYRSQVHPIYKKQNPMYGENHPKLIKYKGKNKKSLNPY